ncbi:hypothetical protein LCGC14_1818410 [marine sediment metagenome]|uniref:Uncharacterized protein n=1 Tax=marine sediment metagenome TaxID=412755 RepID=A0A0F9JJ71_9ZZZZ
MPNIHALAPNQTCAAQHVTAPRKEGTMEQSFTPKSCGCHFASDFDPTEYDGPGFIMCPVHAAAPELLEALEACEPVLRKDGERTLVVRNAGLGWRPEGELPRNLELANTARAAIEEAKK